MRREAEDAQGQLRLALAELCRLRSARAADQQMAERVSELNSAMGQLSAAERDVPEHLYGKRRTLETASGAELLDRVGAVAEFPKEALQAGAAVAALAAEAVVEAAEQAPATEAPAEAPAEAEPKEAAGQEAPAETPAAELMEEAKAPRSARPAGIGRTGGRVSAPAVFEQLAR